MIPHSALANHMFWINQQLEISAADRILQKTPMSFDASVWEFYTPLIAGGALVMAKPGHHQESRYLLRDVITYQVSVLQLVPTMLRMLLDEEEIRCCSSLRRVLSGGEPLSLELVNRASKQLGVEVENLYGPTETTIDSTWWRASAIEETRRVTIGRPVSNVKAYVLDDRHEVVAIGLKGELNIAGAGVGRGYKGKADETARRYVPDGYSQQPGARMYRTGDLVRYLGVGEIDYIGREDHQVKLRGYRIDLGEIESQIREHEAITEAVVIVREDWAGDKRLVAYYESRREVSAKELREHLKGRLPEHMMATAYVRLEQMPLTANGKVDRKGLPEPEQQQGVESEREKTAVEEIVAGMWAEVLKVGRVGVEENFFEIGGHSLLATQVVSRVREVMGVEIGLREMFERPTVEGMAEAVERELGAGGKREEAGIRRVTREGEVLLSYAQQRLWFIHQLEPGNPFYNIYTVARLTGPLDVAALEKTLTEIVSRHEVLRTTFALSNDQPMQVIGSAIEAKLMTEDLTLLPASDRMDEAIVLAKEEALRPFNLGQGPLLRVRLLKLSEDEHIVVFTMHHIISDEWSMGVLIKEVAALYEAYTNGEQSPLEELEVQYADFAVWQRQWLQGEVLDQQMDYWKGQLEGAPAVLELPTDRPRPPVRTQRGARHPFVLNEEMTEQIKRLSRRENVTLFMTLLAAFDSLLSRYTGQQDIVLGAAIANRNRRETESLIGFFVNMLVLRTDLSGGPTFKELLARVREVTLGAYAHQDVPFEKLVEELQPERSLSHTPLFQVALVLQNAPMSALELPGLTLSFLDIGKETASYDLLLVLSETGEKLSGFFEYSTDLFDSSTIMRMANHFHVLLQSAVEAPDTPVRQIPILSQAERYEIITNWNDTTSSYPDACIHELFEQQATLTPDAVALSCDSQQLTYSELNRRANQLAHYLRLQGVKPEVPVALLLERSIEMIVCTLGVLKAGGAYVPLNAEYPEARLSFMLEDTQSPIVLTEGGLVERLPAHRGQVICVDEKAEDIGRMAEVSPDLLTDKDNLAYIMYTSGSTGRPKGVCIEHKSVVRLVRETNYVRLTKRDVILQLAPVTFDASTFEIWGSLLNGGKLVVVSQARASLDEITAAIEEHEVTTLWLTAGLFHLLVSERVEGLSRVKQLLAGGDVLSAEKVNKYLAGSSGKLINGYGPTENTTFTCCEVMSGGEQIENTVPIGRPISNTQVYILDEQQQLAPVGAVGELYAGGEGLARVYLNQADQTAEKFMPDAYSTEAGARLYRTGDLVRWQTDGKIEFIGRGDEQVKVRGFRVELGEVEAALAIHASVKESVVVAKQDGRGDKRLVGYVVLAEGEHLEGQDLRQYLSEKMPDYMVPGTVIVLEKMPLTANGKIDRRALLDIEEKEGGKGKAEVEERSPIEELLAAIWEDVLGVTGVSASDDFFEIGGHSLLATQVVSRLREVFKVEMALREVFERPGLRAQAAEIEKLMSASKGVARKERLSRASRGEKLMLSYAQQRLWFIDQLEPGNNFYNIPIVMKLAGHLNVEALERSLNEIVRRHEVLRTTFSVVEGEPVQVIKDAEQVRLAFDDLSHMQEEEREQRAREATAHEARLGFDLSAGPLLRVKLIRMTDDEHIAVMTMHHIVSDGWSMGVLIKEVAALYEAYTNGEQSPLEELEVQYADFAVWQRQWLQGEVLEQQMDYWRRQLTALPVLDLPTDHPRPPSPTHRGASLSFLLPPDLTLDLKAISRRLGATLFMTLVAAFKLLLSRYSGQQDISVGTPIANRNRVETEPLIGFFVNQLVLRTSVSASQSFVELLRRVREVTLEAYTHQDLPFEMLVEELAPQRDFSRSPLTQVEFALQNAPLDSINFSGLTISSLPADSAIAKFDLTLAMSESKEGLKGTLEYNTDLYCESTASRMLTHFQRLLGAVLERPYERISEIELLTEAERQRILVEWNETESQYPADKCVHELFEAQAERAHDAVAVTCEGECVTYGRLERRANQLANFLQACGVGPEMMVGICIKRSLDMVIGLLGTLKAGGAYMPLDPTYPKDRLAFMLKDGGVEVLITDQQMSKEFSDFGGNIICLDSQWPAIAQQSEDKPANTITIDNLAYVNYTSGSTGRPKGIAIHHRGIIRLLLDTNYIDLGASDVVAQASNYSFDAATFEIWGALISGARLVVVTNDVVLSPSEFARQIREQQITSMFLTTALFNHIAREHPSAFGSLRSLLFGGEAVDPLWVKEILADEPPQRLLHVYGPTESTTFATWHLVEEVEEGAVTIPIGHPISNTKCYLLDQNLRPVPIGVTGQLHIGGAGLARGYLNRPELTAEKFIPDPLSEEAGKQLYQSGDLAKYLEDGSIEFQGRIDHQVKLRGYRIELAEVETVLRQREGVEQAVALVSDGVGGERRLVAYVICQGEMDKRGMRDYMRARLPEYMVPSAFVQVEQVPLTPNGKIDRKALQAIEQTGETPREDYVAPRTQVEEAVAEVFREVLEIELVGVHDNFFELGGHSLMATQMVARLRKTFNVEIPLRVLFTTAFSVEEIADFITRQQIEQVGIEGLAELFDGLNELSDEEAKSLLADELMQ